MDMPEPDLNLLIALDALLAEASVTRAARTLHLSTSAMSRTLTRLRAATGDPLLVRAGRELVLTPYAEGIRERARAAVGEARALLSSSAATLDLATLERTFTLRANEAFAQALGARLIGAVAAQAPGVRLHFLPNLQKHTGYLRDGTADLEIGVVEEMGPEVRTRALFRDRYVGVVRAGHPLAGLADVPAAQYTAYGHVAVPYGERIARLLDAALAEQHLQRRIVAVLPNFTAALAVVRDSDLVALLPASVVTACAVPDTPPAVQAFELPVPMAPFAIAQMWHPRSEADPAHRWLRELVLAVCRDLLLPPAGTTARPGRHPGYDS
jgi:DNA-binding transcriptional LysR family regulator